MIGGSAPSAYLASLQSHTQVQLDDVSMNKLLRSHHIPVEPLRADDFEAFYEQRQKELLELIERAMGKALSPE